MFKRGQILVLMRRNFEVARFDYQIMTIVVEQKFGDQIS